MWQDLSFSQNFENFLFYVSSWLLIPKPASAEAQHLKTILPKPSTPSQATTTVGNLICHSIKHLRGVSRLVRDSGHLMYPPDQGAQPRLTLTAMRNLQFQTPNLSSLSQDPTFKQTTPVHFSQETGIRKIQIGVDAFIARGEMSPKSQGGLTGPPASLTAARPRFESNLNSEHARWLDTAFCNMA